MFMIVQQLIFCTVYPVKLSKNAILCHNSTLFKMSLIRFIKTFNPGNNLKWNYEALALQIKVKSNKKTPPTNLQWLFEVACM